MRSIKALGTGLIVVLVGGILLASGAGASEYNLKMLPEVGRCKFVGQPHGEFRGKKCTLSEPGKGGWEWFSGTGAKPKFTSVVKPPIEFIASSTAATFKCTSGTAEGEYTSPKNLRLNKLVLQSCGGGEGQCQNEVGSTLGEISFKELEGTLGFISHPRKLKIGWDLRPLSGKNLATFECGATALMGKSAGNGIPRELQGSAIGRTEPFDKMVTSDAIVFALVKGKQQYEKFEGGVKDTLITQLGEKLPGTGKTPIATKLVARLALTNEEALATLGKCTGTGC
jgi:hypothetical protein